MMQAKKKVRHNAIRRPTRPCTTPNIMAHLCQNAQTLITAVQQSPASIVITDNEGRAQYVNPKFTRLTGYTIDEVRGQTMSILKTGHTSQETYADLWNTVKGGQEWHGRFLNKKKNGELYWEQASISPVFDRHGHISNFVAVKEDITARVRAEQTIQELNQQLEARVAQRTQQLQQLNGQMTATLNSNNDAIFLLNEANKLESINPAFTRMFGYTPQEKETLESFALVAPESRALYLSTLDQARQQGSATIPQYEARRKDGTTFFAACSIGLVPRNGHLVCNVHDITPLVEANRLKERFVSMVNHELRTPLTVMLLQTQMLANFYTHLTDEERLEKLGQINQQAAMLTDLINGILDLSRLDLQASHQETEPVNMNDTAVQALSQIKLNLEGKQQQWHLQQADDCMECTQIQINKEALKLIWRNLISNAHKYTPEKGTIWLRIGWLSVTELGTTLAHELRPFPIPADLPRGNYVVGQVEDNGYGIPADEQSHLFDRFYRGWAQRSQIPGTGLGLPLVKEVVNQYDGGIVAESEVTKGSCFSFYLPVM